MGKIILFTALVLFHLKAKTQNNSGCFIKHQLMKMQSTTLDNSMTFLNDENWSFDGTNNQESIYYFGYPINYDVTKWSKSSYQNGGNLYIYTSNIKPNIVIYQPNLFCYNNLLKSFHSKAKTIVEEDKLITLFQENTITIEFRESPNDYSSRQYSVLIYDSKSLSQEIQSFKNKEEALKIEAQERAIRYENSISEGDSLLREKKFQEAKFKYLLAKELDETDFVISKIDACEKAICDEKISEGDLLFRAEKYEKALNLFNEAKECSSSSRTLDDKIRMTEDQIRKLKIEELTNEANKYLLEKKYDLALEKYNYILTLDNDNFNAYEKVKEIQQNKIILEQRSTTLFSYENTNKNDFLQLKKLLLEDINVQISSNKNGHLRFNYLISFDTSGNNLSSVDNISTSIENYSVYLNNTTQSNILKQATKGDYFIAAQKNMSVDLVWNSSRSLFKSTSKGISSSEYNSSYSSSLQSFINKQSFRYGKYSFEVKEKKFNGKIYSDINLIEYNTVGPSAALLSAFMPGMGTLKVSYGEKGRGRFACFVLSTGLSITSKLFSNEQYNRYLGATTQAEIDKFYDNANLSHKISLLSGGISASIYLYDIIWVFSKGVQNLNRTKSLRNQLKYGPIKIQSTPIQW